MICHVDLANIEDDIREEIHGRIPSLLEISCSCSQTIRSVVFRMNCAQVTTADLYFCCSLHIWVVIGGELKVNPCSLAGVPGLYLLFR